jgi:hypothetical protein
MNDDRVVRRAALGFENARHGSGIERVRAKAVNRFRGKGDQTAAAENVGGGS